MLRHLICLLVLFTTVVLYGQDRTLPTDFRQHNLTQFNASLVNPTYALDWNLPNALSVWTRWQWQTIDGDPTTLFINYTQRINANAAAGVGFLQHNTGTYLNSGLNLNYVHAFQLESNIRLFIGANVFGFREKLADDRFIPDPDVELPELESTDDFIFMFSPAVRLQVDDFNLGLAVENVGNINLSDSGKGRGDGGTVIVGTASNDFPVTLFNGLGHSFVRPMVYVKSIPDGSTQVGVNGLLSTSKFWVQGGYNSFYGVSGGLGVTIANHFSLGGLVELGVDDTLRDEKSTLELVVSYHMGTTDNRKKVVDFDWEKDDALAYARIEAEEEQRRKEEEKRLAAEQRLNEEERLVLREQEKRDSIAAAALAEANRLAEQQRLDSIARAQKQKVELLPNERYEEVASAEGLEPGFYLIANVFGTKKYYESFMLLLKKRGLEPKSFYRSQNKFNYVYLKRYNTMQEARRARDSKFDGKYTHKTWIFRVRGD
ncbi:PorP/SprF family type IX secretion system membrane protein [Flagellimonas myxillae]|uniref:PorP/SprF family type IX secretion system membrane protein n=1 Tax=Flagellimonas myxillae TaxID=2942214 RepID=UPI00201EBF53|nr:PorP/SprF family type IX secretion system membrane protein [Muricauda myxillae]MCL6265689.1 PorP/SprF family type IX secretion system membrane protein [Muricauda myxillae]